LKQTIAIQSLSAPRRRFYVSAGQKMTATNKLDSRRHANAHAGWLSTRNNVIVFVPVLVATSRS
jgi:hypothetical protein